MNMENLRKIVDEYKREERVLYQIGSFHLNQGFTVFPIRVEEIELYQPRNSTIFNRVTPLEARDLSTSEFCTNKEAIIEILERIL